MGSFQALVQSAVADPEYLLERIDSFLVEYRAEIEGMTVANFSHMVDVYRSTLLRQDLTLGDQAAKLWYYISTGITQFDYNEQKLGVLDSVNVTTLLDFYDTIVLNPQTYRKMIIAAHGCDDSGEIRNVLYPLDYASLNQTTLHYP